MGAQSPWRFDEFFGLVEPYEYLVDIEFSHQVYQHKV
jgi:hypothetical protein